MIRPFQEFIDLLQLIYFKNMEITGIINVTISVKFERFRSHRFAHSEARRSISNPGDSLPVYVCWIKFAQHVWNEWEWTRLIIPFHNYLEGLQGGGGLLIIQSQCAVDLSEKHLKSSSNLTVAKKLMLADQYRLTSLKVARLCFSLHSLGTWSDENYFSTFSS